LKHPEVGLVVSDPDQVILEADPYSRLSYRWHSFMQEWVSKVGMDEATADVWRTGLRSTVTYDIEPAALGATRLTVIY
jgi:hypothetical protein